MQAARADSLATMRARSLARSSTSAAAAQLAPTVRRAAGTTLRASAATLLVVAVALPATAQAAKVSKPASPAATLSGKRVSATWTATTGKVDIAVRRPVGTRLKVTVRSVSASQGEATITLRGATPVRTKVRVRLRRCTGSGHAKHCSAWTTWETPAAPTTTTSSGTTGTSGTTTTPGSTTNTPGVGTIAPGTTTPVTTAPGDGPTIGGCPQMPSNWALNQRVDALPVAAKSDDYVNFIGAGKRLHPDFGSADLGAGPDGFGIPFRVVPADQAKVSVAFREDMYQDESDPGQVPIPLDTAVEGGPDAPDDADRHVSVVQQGDCKLYELGNARAEGGHWLASGSYRFDLVTGAPRPFGWTSGDAAGLPIEPLLARYDEVAGGQIKHAIRMTAHGIANALIAPASHYASTSSSPDAPPMGQRFRMKAGYDISGLKGQAKVVATAMKQYGVVLADTGSDWYFTGAPDRRWDDDDLGQLKGIPGSAFEAVDSGPIVRR